VSLTIDDEAISSVCVKMAEALVGWSEEPWLRIENIGLLASYVVDGTVNGCQVNGEISITAIDGEIEFDRIEITNVGGMIGACYYSGDDEANVFESVGSKTFGGKSHGKAFGGKSHGGGQKHGKGSGGNDNGPESTLIQNCISSGTMDIESSGGVYRIGGLTGSSFRTTIDSCYSMMEINGNAYIVTQTGGIAGWSTLGEIYNSFAAGDININAYYAGIEGAIGGIVGDSDVGEIYNSFAAGDITITAKRACNIGGIAGNTYYGWIDSCYTTGDITVTAEGIEDTGGIAGWSYYGYMENCYTTGDIIVEKLPDGAECWVWGVGGIAGYFDGYMNNCYALNERVAVNFAADESECIGRIVGYYDKGEEEEEPVIEPSMIPLEPEVVADETYNYAWANMIGTFTTVLENEIDIPSVDVWNKTDWIVGESDEGMWILNDYEDFLLPVFTWYLGTFEADASHLKPSGGGGGKGTGQAIVVGPTNQTNSTTSDPRNDGNSQNGNSPNDNDTPPEPPVQKSGFNWILALIIAFILLVLTAVGYYLYKTDKLG